jgi:hypothetical protein
MRKRRFQFYLTQNTQSRIDDRWPFLYSFDEKLYLVLNQVTWQKEHPTKRLLVHFHSVFESARLCIFHTPEFIIKDFRTNIFKNINLNLVYSKSLFLQKVIKNFNL